MKISLLACAVAASLCAVSAAEAQQPSRTSQRNSRAAANTTTITRADSPTFTRQQRAARTEFSIQGSRTDGVIARTIRSGNPLQMINPFAPDEYGDGRDVTRRDVDDPFQRAQGIKLATVEF